MHVWVSRSGGGGGVAVDGMLVLLQGFGCLGIGAT